VAPSEPLSSWTFEALMKNKTMDETIWQKMFAWLFTKRYVGTGHISWEQDAEQRISELSTVQWDGVNPPTISAAVEAHIGQHVYRREGDFRAANAPRIIRVCCHNQRDSEMFVQRHLLQLKIQSEPMAFSLTALGDADGGKVQARMEFPPLEHLEYRCVAVVMPRREENDMDRILLYERDGFPVSLACPPAYPWWQIF
jgi:hypothetical protein